MLPRELPISDDAVEAAALAEARWQGCVLAELNERHQDVYRRKARRAIVAFLQAEGFEVEETAAYKKGNLSIPHFTGPVERPGWERVEPLCRLISPWKPTPSSTEGDEA